MVNKYQLGPNDEELAKNITVQETTLPGVLKIKRKVTKDHRGYYAELYSKRVYFANGITIDFEDGEQTASFSIKNALRGLHGDSRTWKLITCLLGEFYLVVLNYNPASEHFGKWESFILSAENGLQILVPPRHCNGHLALSDQILFHYNQSQYYSGPEIQNVVKWNDPRFNISWPTTDPILSDRDRKGASYIEHKH